NLIFTQVSYVSANLSWNPSIGALHYNVYKLANSGVVKLNSSPITNTSFFIDGLTPNVNYTFFVTAVNDEGSHSDRSDYAHISTTSLPLIIGSNVLCSGNATYSLSSLIPGFTVLWSSSSNIQITSQSSTSVVVNALGNGSGYISARITSPQGQVLNLQNKENWVGAPTISSFDFIDEMEPYVLVKDHRPNFENLVILTAYDAAIQEASWYYPSGWSVYYTNNGIKNKTAGFVIPRSYRYNYGNISVKVRNECGWSGYRNKRFDVIDGFGGFKSIQGISNNLYESTGAFSVNPNIVTDFLSISLNKSNDGINSEFIILDTKGVVIYQNQFNQNTVEVNVSGWAKGVYYIKLVSESEHTWKKFIIN
ncbi:MAG: fibronectin type III domain-containing protein, partial [Bacteroidales bacterium]|nr:fibronectin type III domain-containing protein [Bacteroidales bacterium]